MTNICSKVPLSRSRTTAWDMIAITDSIRIAAIRPGIIVFTVRRRGVEQHPNSRVDPGTRRRETLLDDPIRVELGDDLGGVAAAHCGRPAVRSVDDDADWRYLAALKACLGAFRNDDRDPDLAAIHQRLQLGLALQVGLDGEVAGAGEGRGQLPGSR